MPSSLDSLTLREREVARMAATGVPTKSIAAALDVEESTVKVHVKHIFLKLGARNRSELSGILGLAVTHPTCLSLTGDQERICALIAEGRTNKEIVRQLGVSAQEINTTIRWITRNANVPGRVGVGMWWRAMVAPAPSAALVAAGLLRQRPVVGDALVAA